VRRRIWIAFCVNDDQIGGYGEEEMCTALRRGGDVQGTERSPDGHVPSSWRLKRSALHRECSTSRTECRETWTSLSRCLAQVAVCIMTRPWRAQLVRSQSAWAWTLARAAGNCHPAPEPEHQGGVVGACMHVCALLGQVIWYWPRILVKRLVGVMLLGTGVATSCAVSA